MILAKLLLKIAAIKLLPLLNNNLLKKSMRSKSIRQKRTPSPKPEEGVNL
ncbi:hypothetical protein NEOC65_000434 [Neochlamydia sp. AcF65]|nr:hypothetical protein [Neochlamydia sp. AcF65]